MTSPSPRKRRITRQSIRQWSTGSLALAMALGAGAAGMADAPPSPESNATSAASKLNDLRQRSAAERWEKLKQQWNVPNAEQPAANTIAAPAAAPLISAESVEVWQPHATPKAGGNAVTPDAVAVEESQAPGLRPDVEARMIQPVAEQREPIPAPAADEFGPMFGTDSRAVPPRLNNTEDVPEVLPPLPGAAGMPPRIAQQDTNAPRNPAEREVRRPLLKPISDIQPFYSYEPDVDVRGDDPCRYLCPRPDGSPCPELDGDSFVANCPAELTLSDEMYGGRYFPEVAFNWEASNFWHNPLYFEDPALERYGHTYPFVVQPFVSVGRFSAQLIGLPYQMALDPICEQKYALGWYRPGEPAPKLHYQVPLNAKAAAVQAGVTTGAFFLFP